MPLGFWFIYLGSLNLTSSDKSIKTSKSRSHRLQLLFLYQSVSGRVIQEGGGIAAGRSLAVCGTEAVSAELEIEFHR